MSKIKPNKARITVRGPSPMPPGLRMKDLTYKGPKYHAAVKRYKSEAKAYKARRK